MLTMDGGTRATPDVSVHFVVGGLRASYVDGLAGAANDDERQSFLSRPPGEIRICAV